MHDSTPDATPPGDLLAQVADLLACPLMLVDAQARLHFANRAAQEQLAAASPLVLDLDERVQPAAAEDREPFSRALHAAVTGLGLTLTLRGGTVSLRRLQPPGGRADEPPRVLLALGRDPPVLRLCMVNS
jgi:hypothetical protein